MEKRISDCITLRKPIVKENDLFAIISLFLFAIGISELKIISLVILVAYGIYKIKYLKKRNPEIKIDKVGIYNCRQNINYKWDELERVLPVYSAKGNLLRLEIKGIGFSSEIDVSDLSLDPTKLNLWIELYSKKRIVNEWTAKEKEISNILKTEKSVREIRILIESMIRRMSLFFVLFFMPLVITTIYAQVIFKFPYVFAFGFSLLILILTQIVNLQLYYFKKIVHYSLIDKNKSRKQIALIVIIALTFFVSYLVSS